MVVQRFVKRMIAPFPRMPPTPATRNDTLFALSYTLRFDLTGRPHSVSRVRMAGERPGRAPAGGVGAQRVRADAAPGGAGDDTRRCVKRCRSQTVFMIDKMRCLSRVSNKPGQKAVW